MKHTQLIQNKKRKGPQYVMMFLMLTIISVSTVFGGNYLGKMSDTTVTSKASALKLRCGYVDGRCDVYNIDPINPTKYISINKEGSKQCVAVNDVANIRYPVITSGINGLTKVEGVSQPGSFMLGCMEREFLTLSSSKEIPNQDELCIFCDSLCITAGQAKGASCTNVYPKGDICRSQVGIDGKVECIKEKLFSEPLKCGFCNSKCQDTNVLDITTCTDTNNPDNQECIIKEVGGIDLCAIRQKPIECEVCDGRCLDPNDTEEELSCSSTQLPSNYTCTSVNKTCQMALGSESSLIITPHDSVYYSESIDVLVELSPSNLDVALEYRINDGEYEPYIEPVYVGGDVLIDVRATWEGGVSTASKKFSKFGFSIPKNLTGTCGEGEASITFGWDSVQGAKGYLVSVYSEDASLVRSEFTKENILTFTNIQINHKYSKWKIQPLYRENSNPSTILATKHVSAQGEGFLCSPTIKDSPIIYNTPIQVNVDQVQINGLKSVGSSVYINNKEVVAINDDSLWTYTGDLEVGENTFAVKTNLEGNNSKQVTFIVNRCESGDLNCDTKIDILDFLKYIKKSSLQSILIGQNSNAEDDSNSVEDDTMERMEFSEFQNIYTKGLE